MKIAVLGAGMVGRTIATDLSKKFEVTSFDISESNLAILKLNTNVQCVIANLLDYDNYEKMLASFNLIVCAVPGFMGFKTLETVIKIGKNVADISFFSEDGLQLNALAKQKNVTAIIDCGVAPGMSNLILGYHNAQLKIDSFDCMVGGLPKVRVKPFEYKAPFSPIDVIEEYTRPARYVENGHLVTKPALSDAELLNFEYAGTLESFNTDGLRSILYTMKNIPNMKEKTLRYPGHIALIQSLQQAGFFSENEINVKGKTIRPLDLTTAILFDQWKQKDGEAEFTIMKIIIKGEGKTIEYLLYDEYDVATQTASMSRTTGYACNAFANLIANNIFTHKGVFPPELVGKDENCFKYVMQYLKERNVNYAKTIS
ncbi:MAG: saccharopine dehydrogenase [Ferruginibacter sp.]|nr:saccharopine dehydrogenase [Ferruginibacter sp.]